MSILHTSTITRQHAESVLIRYIKLLLIDASIIFLLRIDDTPTLIFHSASLVHFGATLSSMTVAASLIFHYGSKPAMAWHFILIFRRYSWNKSLTHEASWLRRCARGKCSSNISRHGSPAAARISRVAINDHRDWYYSCVFSSWQQRYDAPVRRASAVGARRCRFVALITPANAVPAALSKSWYRHIVDDWRR